MSQRGSDRKKWRLPCEIQAAGTRHSGFVLDLSSSGLFIQTNATTSPGQQIAVSIALPNGGTAELEARIARKKVVPPRLLAVAQGGVGVQIVYASESFYAFVEELGIDPCGRGRRWRGGGGAGDATDPGAEAPPAEARFRVRISQVSGPRSRRVEVEAPDAEAAGGAALEAAGEGWKVLDVEPL